VGYAPRRNPEIIVAILLQGGEHGALAAPVARDIIKAYYDKKTAQKGQNYTVKYERIDIPPDHGPDRLKAEMQAHLDPKPDAHVAEPVSAKTKVNR
jgi:hypothetical protein